MESIPEKNSLDSTEGVPTANPREISDAIRNSDFNLARTLAKKNLLSSEDLTRSAMAAFGSCLINTDEQGLEKAKKILQDFNLPEDKVNERLVFFMSENLGRLYFWEVFPRYSKYFEITEEMKKAAGRKAIEEYKKLGPKYADGADELIEYFGDLLPEYKSIK